MRRAVLLIVLAILTAACPAAARAPDVLAIGITQYPSTLNPVIDEMAAKSYVLAMTRRPLTTYDAAWHLVCMLCVTLPSFANGLAQKLPLPGGKTGVRLTFELQPNARWGDGVPVTTDDVIFSYEVGKDPKTGVADAERSVRLFSEKVMPLFGAR